MWGGHAHEMDPVPCADVAWYARMYVWICVRPLVLPGYGIGFERMIQYFTGIANIRDAIPFPRHAGSCRL